MAVITIDLDDNASAGLQQLEGELGKVAESTDELAKSAADLTEEQQRQITVIHEHRAGLSSVGVAMAGVVQKGIELAAILAPIIERQRLMAALQGTLSTGLSLTSTALAAQAARWTALEKIGDTAMRTVVGRVTGFAPAIAGATVALSAWEAVMARTGKRTDELGNVTTNLDRIKAAANGLTSDLKEPLVILADNAKQFVSNLNPVPVIWREIDASATRSADQMIININILRDYVKGTRELEEATARLEAQREKEAPGFEAIRRVNETLAAQEQARIRQAEIGSINTVEGINREIQAVREKAARLAQAGEDASKIEQGLLSEIGALEAQRTAIQSREDQRRREIARAYTDFAAEMARVEARIRQQEIDRVSDAADKQLEEIRKAREEVALQEQRADEASIRSRELMREQALQAEVRRKEQEATAARLLAAEEIRTEQEKQAKLKALRQQALEKAGVNGQQLLNQADPRSVAKLLQEQAGQAARAKAAADNQDLFRQAQFDGGGAARKKYDRLLEQAQRDAELQARQQFARGQVDPQQLAQAQAQVAGKQLQSLQASGKLSADSVQAMTELLQATASNQAQTQALQKVVDQLTRDAAAVNQQARSQQQRNRAQANSQ